MGETYISAAVIGAVGVLLTGLIGALAGAFIKILTEIRKVLNGNSEKRHSEVMTAIRDIQHSNETQTHIQQEMLAAVRNQPRCPYPQKDG